MQRRQLSSTNRRGARQLSYAPGGCTPFDHRIGGSLPPNEVRNRPRCGCCSRPLLVVLRLDLHDPALGLGDTELQRAWILTCASCEARTEPLHYRIRRERIHVRRHGFGEPLPEPEMASLPSIPVRLRDRGPRFLDGAELMHQIGGEPFWIDDERVPPCTSCGRSMSFLAQIDSDPAVGLRFGDQGMLYAFDCEDCREFATFVQCF